MTEYLLSQTGDVEVGHVFCVRVAARNGKDARERVASFLKDARWKRPGFALCQPLREDNGVGVIGVYVKTENKDEEGVKVRSEDTVWDSQGNPHIFSRDTPATHYYSTKEAAHGQVQDGGDTSNTEREAGESVRSEGEVRDGSV